MTNFNRLGPLNKGPMTGRGLGPCNQGFGFGRNFRSRFGRGLGRFFGWDYPQTKTDQIKDLKEYKKALEEELESVTKEVEEVKSN